MCGLSSGFYFTEPALVTACQHVLQLGEGVVVVGVKRVVGVIRVKYSNCYLQRVWREGCNFRSRVDRIASAGRITAVRQQFFNPVIISYRTDVAKGAFTDSLGSTAQSPGLERVGE